MDQVRAMRVFTRVIDEGSLAGAARALDMARTNLLIADDVGLGKTIEAGLVIQEMLLRHRAPIKFVRLDRGDVGLDRGLQRRIPGRERVAEAHAPPGGVRAPFLDRAQSGHMGTRHTDLRITQSELARMAVEADADPVEPVVPVVVVVVPPLSFFLPPLESTRASATESDPPETAATTRAPGNHRS